MSQRLDFHVGVKRQLLDRNTSPDLQNRELADDSDD